MTSSVLGLTAGFIFVVVLLLALNLRTPYHWGIKAGSVLIAFVFYIITVSSLSGFYGWPTKQALPQKFELIGMEIEEPRNEADSGVIYMWVSPLSGNATKPRAYELPYNQELHTRLTAAKKRMEFGHSMAGEIEPDAKSANRRGDIPRFYFIEKQRPPPKAGQ